jgi:hypothetical protein
MPKVRVACSHAECDKTFADASSMKRHKRRHHTNLPSTCDLCNKLYDSWELMIRHRKKHQLISQSPDVMRPRLLKLQSFCTSTERHLAADIRDVKRQLLSHRTATRCRPHGYSALNHGWWANPGDLELLLNGVRWIRVGNVHIQAADAYLDGLPFQVSIGRFR